jgi:hypothetical protein
LDREKFKTICDNNLTIRELKFAGKNFYRSNKPTLNIEIKTIYTCEDCGKSVSNRRVVYAMEHEGQRRVWLKICGICREKTHIPCGGYK